MADSIMKRVGALLGWAVEALLLPLLMPIVEANLIPDFVTRFGIRLMLRNMLHGYNSRSFAQQVSDKLEYVKDLKTRALAEHTVDANKQHYEVPAAFYENVMGPWKKYSCGIWPAGCKTLAESEEAALKLVCERAQITNTAGLRVLDMGCGWGSFTLYCATKFPNVQITSVSNSASQKAYIMSEAAKRGLKNVNVITCDINDFDGAGKYFDRVVSIEMMEHVKNYSLLLQRVATWMKTGAKMFVHIFTHKQHPFHYVKGWMAENFFTGGQMPSDDLLLYFQQDLALLDHWVVNGAEYEKTSNAWLEKFDENRETALKVIEATYGKENKTKWVVNWRLFFIACAELFGFDGGNEWAVSHYLFEKPARA